jgi:3-polyprenyl-4-hydroxybenzoate decarboxylase
MVDHSVGRVLDLFDIDTGLVGRWTGEKPAAPVIPMEKVNS